MLSRLFSLYRVYAVFGRCILRKTIVIVVNNAKTDRRIKLTSYEPVISLKRPVR